MPSFMYVCMYSCMYVCMYACMHVCGYVCMPGAQHECCHLCMYVCIHVCMYVCMHACMHVCRYVCMPGAQHECHHFRRHTTDVNEFVLFKISIFRCGRSGAGPRTSTGNMSTWNDGSACPVAVGLFLPSAACVLFIIIIKKHFIYDIGVCGNKSAPYAR